MLKFSKAFDTKRGAITRPAAKEQASFSSGGGSVFLQLKHPRPAVPAELDAQALYHGSSPCGRQSRF